MIFLLGFIIVVAAYVALIYKVKRYRDNYRITDKPVIDYAERNLKVFHKVKT